MHFGGGTVEADGEASEAALLKFADGIAREQRCGTWSQRDANAVVGGVLNQIEDIRTLQGIAASEHEHRSFQFGDLIDETFRLSGGEFKRAADRLRTSAAVNAGKVTGLGSFPNDDEGPLIEIECWDHVYPPTSGSSMTEGRTAACDLCHARKKACVCGAGRVKRTADCAKCQRCKSASSSS